MTLAALFAMTAGAWAGGTLQVTEIKASDISAWDGDQTKVTAADLPGFKAMTFDEAKAWAEAPSGDAILIYAFDGNDAKYVHFNNGAYNDTYSQSISRGMIYNSTYYGQQIFYTGAPASSETQTLDITEAVAGKQWTAVMPAGNVVFQVEYDPWKVTLQQTANGTVEAVTGGGDDVTANGDGTYSVVPGKSITLKATPKEGYRLAGWYKVDGNDVAALTEADGAVADAEAGTLTLTPEADVTIRAQFAEQTYTVTLVDKTFETNANVTATVAGSDATITEDGKIEGVTKGQTVILNAQPGYKFRKVEVKKGGAGRPAAEATADDKGKLIGADGNIYDDAAAATAAGTTAVAKIIYLGSETGDATYTHGLALALADEGEMTWETAVGTCSGKNTSAAVPGASWMLPSQVQWNKMISAAGSYTALRDGFSSVGGTNMSSYYYWSSTEIDSDRVYYIYFGNGNWGGGNKGYSDVRTRAVLAF